MTAQVLTDDDIRTRIAARPDRRPGAGPWHWPLPGERCAECGHADLEAPPVCRCCGTPATVKDQALIRLHGRGWTDQDVSRLLTAVAGESAAERGALTIADFLTEHVPGISVAETAAWVTFFHTPTAEHPTAIRVLRHWFDRAGPGAAARDVLPAPAYLDATRGDHHLARLALAAGLSADEIADHVAAGTVDREALAMMAVLAQG